MKPAQLFLGDGASGADISECGRYRHRLWRWWDESKPMLCWVMLNPSTADANLDDATIRRCRHYARREGFGGIMVVNLFELRATDPRELSRPDVDAIGPDAGRHWLRAEVLAGADHGRVVAGWGANKATKTPSAQAQIEQVRRWAGDALVCLGTTKDGGPRHPGRLRNDEPLVRWPSPHPLGAT